MLDLFLEILSYLRIGVGLNEDFMELILKQYTSTFVIYEILPGIYTIEENSEAVYTMGDHDGTLQIQYDDISMKTKLVLTCFGGTIRTLRFNLKSSSIQNSGSHLIGTKNLLMKFMLIAQAYVLAINF